MRHAWIRTLAMLLVGLAVLATSAGAAPLAASGPSAAPSAPVAAHALAPPAALQGARLRAASQNVAGDVAMYVAADRGYFQQEGLDVELVSFANATEMNAALATEQVDVAGIGGTAGMWNAVARGVRMKQVLDKGTFLPGFGFTAILMRPELYASSGGNLAGLRGRSIGMIPPGLGSANGAVLSVGLPRAGLTTNDVNIVSMPFPDMIPALANGAIDAAMIGEPFQLRAIRQAGAVRVVGNDELYPNATVSALCFTPTLYANRTAAKGFAKAYIRAIRDYMAAVTGQTSEADRQSIEAIMSRYTRIDTATIRDMIPVGFNLNGLPDQGSLLFGYQFFREQGLIPQPLSDADLAAIWGTELVEEALNEIGRRP